MAIYLIACLVTAAAAVVAVRTGNLGVAVGFVLSSIFAAWLFVWGDTKRSGHGRQ